MHQVTGAFRHKQSIMLPTVLFSAWDQATQAVSDVEVACREGDVYLAQAAARVCDDLSLPTTWEQQAWLAAASHGHVPVLQWLRERTPAMLQSAAAAPAFDVDPGDFVPRVARAAAAHGHVSVLQWLHASGVQVFMPKSNIVHTLATEACRAGQWSVQVLDWLADKLCPERVFNLLLASASLTVAEWVLDRFGTQLDAVVLANVAHQKEVLGAACRAGMPMVTLVHMRWPTMVPSIKEAEDAARAAGGFMSTDCGQPLLNAIKYGGVEVVAWVWDMVRPLYGSASGACHLQLVHSAFGGVDDDTVRFLVSVVWKDDALTLSVRQCSTSLIHCLVQTDRLALVQWLREWSVAHYPQDADLFCGPCPVDSEELEHMSVREREEAAVPMVRAYVKHAAKHGSVACAQWLLQTFAAQVGAAPVGALVKYPAYGTHVKSLQFMQWVYSENPAVFTQQAVVDALRLALWHHNLPAADWLLSLNVVGDAAVAECAVWSTVLTPYLRISTLHWAWLRHPDAIEGAVLEHTVKLLRTACANGDGVSTLVLCNLLFASGQSMPCVDCGFQSTTCPKSSMCAAWLQARTAVGAKQAE